MAIFELSGVDYPKNSLRFINSKVLRKPYVCVLIFMVLLESLVLLDYIRYSSTKDEIYFSKVVSTKVHLDNVLIGRFSVLISWKPLLFAKNALN